MKKKFLALGMTLLAGLTLASCGDDTKATTTTETETVVPTETTPDKPAETSTAPVETYTYHDAVDPTYSTKGNLAYYTKDGETGTYYDEDKKPVELSSLLVDYLTMEGEIISIDENGNAVTSISAKDFHAAYGYEYLLTTKFNDGEAEDIPFVKWVEELESGKTCVTADEKVVFTGLDVNFAELKGLSAGAKFTLKYNDSKLNVSKIEALNYLYEIGPVDVNGRELTVEYESGTEDQELKYGQDVLDAIDAATSTNEAIVELYNTFCDKYYYLVDQYRIAKILSDRDNTTESYDLADELEALVNDFGLLDEKIDLAAYNSIYKEYYYLQYDKYKNDDGTLNEEAVDAYVASLDPDATAQLNEYDKNMSQALSSYYSGESTAAEALYSFFTNAKSYATVAGYEDYLTYAYENQYGREYSVADTDKLADYIATYLIPAQMDALSDFLTYKALAKADTTSDLYDEYMYGLWGLIEDDFYGKYFEYIADYAENVIGDEMGENFKYYFTSGNYWYSATENDNVTGYVWSFSDGTPLMFLGPSCQEIGTFIHEFGHYNEHITAQDSEFYSMDLNEVHSQANEMLFYKYLTTTDVYSEGATKAFLAYHTYMMISAVIEGYLINELEKWTYTQDMSSYADANAFYRALVAKWEEICEAAGMDDYAEATSWVNAVLLNYQGYYISYATSAVAALEVYAYACEDWDAAVTAYKFLYSAHDATDTFTSVLEKAGLKSIFDEDAFKMIADAIGYDYQAAASSEE